MRLLVTGGSGFIGSAVVREAVGRGHSVVNVDKMTYAATKGSTRAVEASHRYVHMEVDIVDTDVVLDLLVRFQPDRIIHLAAESHVDRSIENPTEFVMTNVVGTVSMLAAATRYLNGSESLDPSDFRFHHVSTDEVFGSLESEGSFDLETPYDPRSPYSASKAGADHIVRAWHHTYGLPTVISNCSNNYGPFQFPEKLIPLVTIRALKGLTLPVYGAGENIRDWLFVEDHVSALLRIAENGAIGSTYLVGGDAERRNIDVVRAICGILDEIAPAADTSTHQDRITFVEDRPGHDLRYAIDASETTRALGWSPATSFEDGLRQTVEWYVANPEWWEPLMSSERAVERVGLVDGGGGPM